MAPHARHGLPGGRGTGCRRGSPLRCRGMTMPTSPAASSIDCRGLAARDALPSLRGVRGERILIRSRDVHFSRPIRLLHPRHPLYVVPWADGVHMVGATVIESEDPSPMTVQLGAGAAGSGLCLASGLRRGRDPGDWRWPQAGLSRQCPEGGGARPSLVREWRLPARLPAGAETRGDHR